jgi:hypothetical protein
MEIINISGGYWTGSSALIALLIEHEGVSVVSEEYSAFGYGELFRNLNTNNKKKIANSKLIFEEYNKPEKYRIFRALLRVLFRKMNVFPKSIFVPRINGVKLFGSNYIRFCSKDYEKLFDCEISNQKESLGIFFNSIKSDFDSKNVDLLIIDQMISPSYIKDFDIFDDSIKHIVVDRNWEDQYAEIRSKLISIVGKNIAIEVNPLNEGITSLETPHEMFLTIRRKFNKDLKELKELNNVLILNFEDIINYKIVVQNKVLEFLNLSETKWNEYSSFDERISRKNINKWQKLNIQSEIDFIRKRL